MARETTQFRKGQSGNPGGRPRVVGEVRELAQAHTTEAIEALVKVCQSGKSESARVAAAVALLDRGYGKPAMYVGRPPGDASQFTDDELAAIVAAADEPTANTRH